MILEAGHSLANGTADSAEFEPTLIAIPIFIFTMLVEGWVLARRGHAYEARDTAASLSGGLGNVVIKTLSKVVVFGAFYSLYNHKLLDVRTLLASLVNRVAGANPHAWMWALIAYWAILVFAEDHCYYWYHRASHQVRILWAGHIAHHSSTRYTLSTALRQSWVAPIFGPIFWAPLPLLGFRPEHILLMSSLNLLYQYWIHTEIIRTLGPLEWFMNTPSHHRVHHGKNPEYIDKNHAGMFIIWDRLYGTFTPERAKVIYGLTKDVGSYNPWRIQTHGFIEVFEDVRRAKSMREVLHAMFANPSAFPAKEEPSPEPPAAE